jgi:hypothetical protein
MEVVNRVRRRVEDDVEMLFRRHHLPFSVANSRGGFSSIYTVIMLIALVD